MVLGFETLDLKSCKSKLSELTASRYCFGLPKLRNQKVRSMVITMFITSISSSSSSSSSSIIIISSIIVIFRIIIIDYYAIIIIETGRGNSPGLLKLQKL